MAINAKRVVKTVLINLLFLTLLILLFEILISILPVRSLTRSLRWISLKEAEMSSKQIHSSWGITYLPNVDLVLDYTGRERTQIRTKIRTIPMPGYPEYGMRDDGVDAHAEMVIPVFGDSFTFGATVELDQVWCERIEREHPYIDMLNLANGGGVVKAYEQYRILKDVLPPHDYVIYALWLGNEFIDNYGLSECQIHLNEIRREYETQKKMNRYINPSAFLSLSRETINLILRKFKDSGTSPSQYARGEYLGEHTPQLWHDEFGHFFLHPNNLILVRYCEPEYIDERIAIGIEKTKETLIKFKNIMGSRKLIVFLLPFKEQVYDNIVLPHRPALDLTKPNRIVMDFCSKNNIQCFDLLPVIKKHRNIKMYWDYDLHFNAEGQAIASIEIEKILKRLNIIGKTGVKTTDKKVPVL